LILDEPTEGIQPNIVHEIGEILHELNRVQKLTVLLVEQKLQFARKLADRFLMMERGRKVAAGPIGELTDKLIGQHLAV
jgi:urea transport system ATP-binding protein